MSDNLRTRIAELQRAHMPIDYAGGIDCTCGDNFHPDHGGIDVAEPLWAAHLADAVIREVLTPEFLADMMIAAVQQAADDPSPYNPPATGAVSLGELRSRKAADNE